MQALVLVLELVQLMVPATVQMLARILIQILDLVMGQTMVPVTAQILVPKTVRIQRTLPQTETRSPSKADSPAKETNPPTPKIIRILMLRFLPPTCLFTLFRTQKTRHQKALEIIQTGLLITDSRVHLIHRWSTLPEIREETLPVIPAITLPEIPVGILPETQVGILPEILPDPRVASSLIPTQATTLQRSITDRCWAKKILISKTNRAVALGKLTFPRAAALLLAFHQ